MKCSVYSPLNDCCALDGAHFGPHVSKDKAEWFGGVWLQEPAPKLWQRKASAEFDQWLKDGEDRLARDWAEHVADIAELREFYKQRKLRNRLIAVAVALVLFVVLLSLI